MGKIVKYCAECEEGFAEKFSFCPNCASALTAYEMNPAKTNEVLKVADPVPVSEPIKEVTAPEPPTEKIEAAPVVTPPSAPVTQNFSVNDDDLDLLNDEDFVTDEKPVIASKPEETISTPEEKSPTVAPIVVPATAATSSFSNSFENSADYSSKGSSAGGAYPPIIKTNTVKAQDGLYHITFVEEKNASGRNLLLLGAFLLVTATVFGGIVYSLFRQSPYIGSLSENDVLVAYTDDVPPEELETKPPPPKNKDDGGGGGGGGNKAPTPTSKGVLATQTEKPMIAPSVDMVKVTKPELVIQASTQGNRKETPTDSPYGNPNSKFDIASDGSGSGGGQGAGSGRGQGNGIGTGAGNGIGSGNGNGRGGGNGDGSGDGDGAPPRIPPKPVAPVVEPFKILSKPRANYTDTARQNQVTGVVRVRVQFLPSGAIGSVTPLNSLPYGLTEQAIAAAKQIRFEPQKANGSPVAVTKVIEYSFSIY